MRMRGVATKIVQYKSQEILLKSPSKRTMVFFQVPLKAELMIYTVQSKLKVKKIQSITSYKVLKWFSV